MALGVDPFDVSVSLEAQVLRVLSSELSCVEAALRESERTGDGREDALSALASLRRRADGIAAISGELREADGVANSAASMVRLGMLAKDAPLARKQLSAVG